ICSLPYCWASANTSSEPICPHAPVIRIFFIAWLPFALALGDRILKKTAYFNRIKKYLTRLRRNFTLTKK
ncbi:MAG: hypothetical protein KDH84_03650, partial [Calditrichaeota bacterium]|nr:hypothetical protein [Calditrichota bacterium]